MNRHQTEAEIGFEMNRSISPTDASTILEGIVTLAVKLAGKKPADLRVKVGGDVLGSRGRVDFYASVQNAKASINTSQARSQNLIRRIFRIYQEDDQTDLRLDILEWDAARDSGSGYREIWRANTDFAKRKEMAQLMADAISQLT
jgi:hypothetical protein